MFRRVTFSDKRIAVTMLNSSPKELNEYIFNLKINGGNKALINMIYQHIDRKNT